MIGTDVKITIGEEEIKPISSFAMDEADHRRCFPELEGTVSFEGTFCPEDFCIEDGSTVNLYLGPKEHFSFKVGEVLELNDGLSFSPAGPVRYVSHSEAVISEYQEAIVSIIRSRREQR